MARFKPIGMSPKPLPVDFSRQVVPGSFEYALCHLIDHELDPAAFDARYRNDEVGASAYAPALLLKIVLLACSRGLVSSPAIEAACRTNVRFMVVPGDAAPHFTTLAAFVSERSAEIALRRNRCLSTLAPRLRHDGHHVELETGFSTVSSGRANHGRSLH
jgi:hypothetical protein